MTTKAVKNILEFAEGGAIKFLVVNGERIVFSDEKNQGASEYTLDENEGVLQIIDQRGMLFAAVENINAIRMAV